MKFPDHHPYSSEDLHLIKSRFDELLSRNKVIFTTEKDMMRLRTPELALFLKRLPVFYLPIEICFHGESGTEFNKIIMEYVLHSKKYHPE
jgi:tetraacyldisaccharide 4'-kinase